MHAQLSLFEEPPVIQTEREIARSGTFIDNMALPVHRWFRYSAGFSAQWVEKTLKDWGLNPDSIVLDPFAGSGTVSLACDYGGVRSIGVEAHPVVARIAKAKLLWETPIEQFSCLSETIKHKAKTGYK